MPMDNSELYDNLQKMHDMGAISVQTIMDQSEFVSNSKIEKERIDGEKEVQDDSIREIYDGIE